MITIKFSHKYFKMPSIDTSVLLQVLTMDIKDMSPAFRAYDTEYEGGSYPLKGSGKYMVLLLFAGNEHLRTTVRRWTPEKEAYYKSRVGEIVKIQITETV